MFMNATIIMNINHTTVFKAIVVVGDFKTCAVIIMNINHTTVFKAIVAVGGFKICAV